PRLFFFGQHRSVLAVGERLIDSLTTHVLTTHPGTPMKLVENAQIMAGFVPLDLQPQRDGDWAHLRDYNHLTIVFFKGAGTSGDNATVTLEQATDNAGAGAKALTFTEIWRKQAADIQTVGQFTKSTQAAANTFTNTNAASQAIWVLEIDG